MTIVAIETDGFWVGTDGPYGFSLKRLPYAGSDAESLLARSRQSTIDSPSSPTPLARGANSETYAGQRSMRSHGFLALVGREERSI
jgi:hypothetical protein